jgi:ribonuclease-3
MTSTEQSSQYFLLEERLGHVFKSRSLCESALTHKSWMNEVHQKDRTDNERLEFLGDAVLSLVVSDLLMRRFPEQSEGELSKARASIVNEQGLATIAENLALGQWIFLGKGEEQAGGRLKRSLLSNALEAMLGAVYLDGGFPSAYRTIQTLFANAIEDLPFSGVKDFKSRLQEVAQAKLQLAPTYVVLAEQGPDHAKIFEVAIRIGEQEYARASGRSKKEAQQNAAEVALGLITDERRPHGI